MEVPNKVRALITDGMFYGTSRVLTLMVTHHPDLDFAAIYRGYADGWSIDEIHVLGESLVPYAQMVAEPVTVQWVMEAHHSTMVEDVRREDVVQPVEGVEARSEVSVIPPPTEPNVVSTGSELPLSSSTVPSAMLLGSHNRVWSRNSQ